MSDPTAGLPAVARFLVLAIGREILEFRFLRFLGGGVLNTIFGYAVFVIALHLGCGIGIALIASTLLGVVFNFHTSRHLVFRSRRQGLQLRFLAVYATVLPINYVAILLLKRVGFESWAAQAVAVLPLAALAFILQRHLVFGDDRGMR